jgi:hypothetical protein
VIFGNTEDQLIEQRALKYRFLLKLDSVFTKIAVSRLRESLKKRRLKESFYGVFWIP